MTSAEILLAGLLESPPVVEAHDGLAEVHFGAIEGLTDEEIRETLEAHPGAPQEACRALVARANEHGGEDNITVVILHNPA